MWYLQCFIGSHEGLDGMKEDGRALSFLQGESDGFRAALLRWREEEEGEEEEELVGKRGGQVGL